MSRMPCSPCAPWCNTALHLLVLLAVWVEFGCHWWIWVATMPCLVCASMGTWKPLKAAEVGFGYLWLLLFRVILIYSTHMTQFKFKRQKLAAEHRNIPRS